MTRTGLIVAMATWACVAWAVTAAAQPAEVALTLDTTPSAAVAGDAAEQPAE